MTVPATESSENIRYRFKPWRGPAIASGPAILGYLDELIQGDRQPWLHLLEYHQERDTLPAADLDDGTLVYR